MGNIDGLVNIYMKIVSYLEVCENFNMPNHQEKHYFIAINGNASCFQCLVNDQ